MGAGEATLNHLRKLTNLESLFLSNGGGNITNAGLTKLKPLEKLRVLDLNGTAVTDSGLSHLKTFKNLEVLDLGSTRVTGEGFISLLDHPNLKSVSLSNTRPTPKGLKTLASSKLESLWFDSCHVTDEDLKVFVGQETLKEFAIPQTPVTAKVLQTIRTMPRLEMLRIYHTRLDHRDLAKLQKERPGLSIQN